MATEAAVAIVVYAGEMPTHDDTDQPSFTGVLCSCMHAFWHNNARGYVLTLERIACACGC
jgi:hypothetical protein